MLLLSLPAGNALATLTTEYTYCASQLNAGNDTGSSGQPPACTLTSATASIDVPIASADYSVLAFAGRVAMNALVDPQLVAATVPVFDYLTGISVLVTTTGGGNPERAPQRRRVDTLSLAVKTMVRPTAPPPSPLVQRRIPPAEGKISIVLQRTTSTTIDPDAADGSEAKVLAKVADLMAWSQMTTPPLGAAWRVLRRWLRGQDLNL